jgi:hypothetical protein
VVFLLNGQLGSVAFSLLPILLILWLRGEEEAVR